MSEGHRVSPRRSVATRARLYLVGAATLALVVGFGVFAVAWGQYSIRQRSDDLAGQVSALAKGQAVGDQSASSAETGTASARERLLRVEAGLIGAALFIVDDAGAVISATIDDPPASLPIEKLAPLDASGTRRGVLRTGTGSRVVVVSAGIGGDRALVAVQGIREIRKAQAGILVIASAGVLIALAVAYVSGGLLARRLTAPLVRLEGAAESVAQGALGTQVAEEGDIETASLARSFNRMSIRVADTYAAQKAFVGDVSHEIRTPLTSIRGFAEAMLDGTLTDPEQQRRALGVIRDEAVRIGEVSQTLLALSELEAGAVDIACEPVDPSLLADALRGRFSAAAAQADVDLVIDLEGHLRPMGDADRLLQAASALVANAIAYTPAGGTVRVGSAAIAATWVLRVDDSGPGIPVERRGEVFGRFARLGDAQTRQSGGSGLGLAICRRLVELMAGEVTVGDSEAGGARFEIRLPAAGA